MPAISMKFAGAVWLLFLLRSFADGQSHSELRPPATPLVVHDPYFSIWSDSDNLTDENTKHWTGAEQPLTGVIRIDGANFRFMGARSKRTVPAMKQISLRVTPTHTIYTFGGSGIQLVVSFFTPALPEDLDVLSRPVSYLSWGVSSTDGVAHEVSIYLDCDPAVAVNEPSQEVSWSRAQAGPLTVLSAGSQEQRVLARYGDDVRIDWGYFSMAVPAGGSAQVANAAESLKRFIASGALPASDDMDMPKEAARNAAAHPAVVFPMTVKASGVESRHVLLAYNERYSIEFLNRRLRPYWQHTGETFADLLQTAEMQRDGLEKRARVFDDELTADLEAAGGKTYADLGILAYRQTLAAHGLATGLNGEPLMFAKENFSNGCISTVDVLYPSSPFFLLLNPRLLEAQLRPILEYSALPRWRWPFAPHDLGTYPLANGQVYGGGEKTEEDQMPVEESGNLLIVAAALGREEGNWHLAEQYWRQFSQWAEYLRTKGLDPENQLSTDDFAGHLAHNANLSIKAIEGLAAYAQMARGLGQVKVAADYERAAKEMAARWEQLALDGDHYKLAFDKPGTWSQKYNLVWDGVLGFHMFSADVREKELAFYLKHINPYGLPLDNRADYTKLDWQLWTATLATHQDVFRELIRPLALWLNETPSRVPLSDWYDTRNGKQVGFQARSVVGGLFIKLLADEKVAAKWRGRVIQREMAAR